MDPSAVIGFLLVFIPLVMVAAAVGLYFRRGWTERTALESALQTLSGNDYAVVEHPGLRTDEGIVSVDYAVISVYGVFLIMTEDFKGRVDGREADDMWTYAHNGRSAQVANPLKRAQAFARAMEQALPGYGALEPVVIAAYPVRDVLNVQATQHVTYLSKVMDVVRSYDARIFPFAYAMGLAGALRAADVNNGADHAVLSDMM